ncbi:hypothetical protein C1645_839498 [Glomus cerebriforme]|uniref:Uncharacterized protein n=1 Tax=Glomus cerebriforme TaxID=658196 RepID=A0A397S6M0_9GLOM|nr:hypothetical protein C1645_839498 [Glomus cerebriforme]
MARRVGQLKTNTVVQYDEHYDNVESLRYPALSKRPKKIKKKSKSVGFFNLGNLVGNVKLELPVDYEESRPKLEKNYSEKLQFTTEAEAAAIYCMENSLKINELDTPGTNFMTADCGEDKQLGEVTERAGDFCGRFSQSKYSQNRIKQEFQHQVKNISNPIAAISRGAALYGLSLKNSAFDLDRMSSLKFVIDNRVLKYTYGILIRTVVKPNQEVTFNTDQDAIYFRALTFGRMEITATARNKLNGQNYRTTLKLDI